MKTRTNLKAWLTISVFLIGVGLVAQGVVKGDTFTVINTNDSGSGSLREAIVLSNANPGLDLIAFNIPGPGPHTIQLASPLPELNEEVVIDGYSQPGSQPATDTSNAVLNIVLDGSSLVWYNQAFLFINVNASNCVIRGLVINNYQRNGILIASEAGGNVIEGNYIGTDYTGTVEKPNIEFGIYVGDSPNNVIGGTTPASRNVISGNGADGILLFRPAASGNRVLGNFIGTDVTGTSFLPNGTRVNGVGVRINNAPDNLVGGTASGSRNVITDINIGNPDAMNNQVVGNYIGINASGDGPLSDEYIDIIGVHIVGAASHNVIGPDNVVSGHDRGVVIWPGSSYNSVRDNYIGTDATGQVLIGNEGDGVTVSGSHNRIEGNVVSGSLSNGILVFRDWESEMPSQNIIAGNIVGMNASGDAAFPNGNGISINTAVNTTIRANLIAGNNYNGVFVSNDLPWNPGVDLAIGNLITQNEIYDNGELGINLRAFGIPGWVTPNDPGDIDIGPNNLMNFPVLASAMATPGQLIVKGTIDTPNLMNVTLEFFANSAPDDATGYGEGEIYLGAAKPNATGAFTAALPAVSPGMWISATATDPENNTSEFALSIEAVGPGEG